MAGWLEMDPLCWWCGAAAQETETETGFDGQIAHIIKATLQAIQRVFGLPRPISPGIIGVQNRYLLADTDSLAWDSTNCYVQRVVNLNRGRGKGREFALEGHFVVGLNQLPLLRTKCSTHGGGWCSQSKPGLRRLLYTNQRMNERVRTRGWMCNRDTARVLVCECERDDAIQRAGCGTTTT